MNEIERLRDPLHIKDYNMEEWKEFLVEGGLNLIHSEVVPGVYDCGE